MLKWVFYFLQGYVIIKIEGKFPERFLNVAGCKQIHMWRVRHTEDGIVLCVRRKDFRYASAVAAQTDCCVKVLTKQGLPYALKRNKHRKALFFGVFLFGLILFGMLSLVWKVEITGIERIPKVKLEQLLRENGIHPYAFLYGIDKTKAVNRITAELNDIAWMGIEIRGSCAFVEVVETVPKPEIQDKSQPCNLIADKDGIVTRLEIESGVTVVKIGDTITKGQLLVSGIADSPMAGVRFLHAEGEVYLKTWHEQNVSIPLVRQVPEKTGRTKSHFTVEFFGKTIPVWLNRNPKFKSAKQRVKYYGPIQRTVYEELALKTKSQTEEQAFLKAKQAFEAEMKQRGEVIAIRHTKRVENNILHIRFMAELIEKTGVKRMIERETDGENFTD